MSDNLPAEASPGRRQPVEASATDDSLVRRVGHGCEAAADRLFRRYADRLRALAKRKLPADITPRVDADDIVQSVFRRFFESAQLGNYAAPTGDDLWNLLLVITLNRLRTVKTQERAAKRDSRRNVHFGGDQGSLERTAGWRGEQPDAVFRLVIDEAIARMPTAYREVLALRMEEYEIAEIAQRTRRSKRTVERILQESRGWLRELLDEDGVT
jgi:RNA polymerase sigma factor (sigma-70 family)